MKVDVLGHWVSAPAGKGAASSYLVSSDGTSVLLDCGPGTLPLLHERNMAQRLNAIIISHMHRDHMLDLLPFADLRVISRLYPGAPKWEKARLLVPEGGLEILGALDNIWFGNRDGRALEGVEAARGDAPLRRFGTAFDLGEYGGDERLELGDLTVTFQRTRHSHGPCYAARVTDGKATVVYSADSGYGQELAVHAKDADLLLCEATFYESHPYWTQQHGHMTGEQAGRLAAEAGAKRLVLTHLAPDPEVNEANLESARKRFGGVVDLAQTGRVFHV